MKNILIEYFAKHSLDFSDVYDDNGNKVKVSDMKDNTNYYISQLSTKSERTRKSFRDALHVPENKENNKEITLNPVVKIVEQKRNYLISELPLLKKEITKPIKKIVTKKVKVKKVSKKKVIKGVK